MRIFWKLQKKALFVAQRPEALRDISAYLYFLMAKERSGLERAAGAAGFTGGWSEDLVDRFRGLVKEQGLYLSVFKAYATPQELDFYNKTMDDRAVKEVEQMRSLAQKALSPEGRNAASQITGKYWFDMVTQEINLLKKVEDHMAADVHHVGEAGLKAASASMIFYVILVVSLLVAITALTYFILKDLLITINGTRRVMTSLSDGDLDADVIGLGRKDEIGEMARAVEKFKNVLIERREDRARKTEEDRNNVNKK